jgi:hypothetical protein
MTISFIWLIHSSLSKSHVLSGLKISPAYGKKAGRISGMVGENMSIAGHNVRPAKQNNKIA